MVSSGTKSLAKLVNATKRPSALTTGEKERLFALPSPALLTLTSVVVPVLRSRTKMSKVPFVSLATRSLARLWNATKRPSALMEVASEKSLPLSEPAQLTLASSVCGSAVWRPEPRIGRRVKAIRTEQNIVRVFFRMSISSFRTPVLELDTPIPGTGNAMPIARLELRVLR